jgi:hypothetical protein
MFPLEQEDLLPERLEAFVRQFAAEELKLIDQTAESAVAGDRRAVYRYTQAYRQLARKVFQQISPDDPAAVRSAEWAVALSRAPTALFSKAAKHAGPGVGAMMAIVEPALREDELLRLMDLLFQRKHRWAETLERLTDRQRMEFIRCTSVQMSQESPLVEIREALQLSDTELAELFQVSRPAVEKWIQAGIPARRRAQVYAVQKVVRLLSSHLKPERIPAVVRRESDWFDGRSILTTLKDGEHERVLRRVREAFDWGRAA